MWSVCNSTEAHEGVFTVHSWNGQVALHSRRRTSWIVQSELLSEQCFY